MNLRYIAINLDGLSLGFSDKRSRIAYCSEFAYRTSFINNYMSKRIRTYRFKTDGTFHMIAVSLSLTPLRECVIVPDRVLQIELWYDREKYESIKGTSDCGYYLEMFEEGFRRAAEFKQIPLETMLNLIDDFKKNDCKNEWLHKKKLLKEYDIEIALNCYFTTLDFKLVATVKKISTKEELCSGVILETLPDEIFFNKEFKDILISEKNIIITDFLDHPRYIIDIQKALNKEFVFERLPDEFSRSD